MALLGIVVLAALLRFPTLGLQSFDEFESYTVALFAMSLGGMLDALPSYEGTPPLYYLLGWAWSRVLGDGELAVRSLSAVFGTATVPLAYAAARACASRRAALLAAGAVALSPIAVWYSQEARAYAMVTFLVALGLVFFMRELRGAGGSRALNLGAWSAAAALAVATHYFAVLVLAPQAIWLALRPDRRGATLAALLPPLAVGLALIPLAGRQEAHAGGGEPSRTPLGERVAEVVKQLLVGFNLPAEAAIAGAALLGCLVAAYLAFERAPREDRRAARAGGVLAAAAVALLLAMALAGVDYFLTRYLLPIVVPASLVLGAGFARGRLGAAAAALTAAAFLAALVAVAADPLAQRPDLRGGLGDLGPPPPGGRALLVSSFGIRVEAFRPDARPMPSPEPPVREVVVVGLPVVGGDVSETFTPATDLVPGEFEVVAQERTDSYARVVMRAPRPVPVSRLALFEARRPHELFLEP